MDRHFGVLPLMSAGDYITHEDTLCISITINPGSAARQEQSDSSPEYPAGSRPIIPTKR